MIDRARSVAITDHGDVLIGADGIHSAVRHQFHPGEGPPQWSGNVLWRAISRAKPFLTGRSMFMAGHLPQKFVAYPISGVGDDGLCDINWIAELDRTALRAMYPHFLREAQRRPPELIISVFATGAAAAARYRETHDHVASVVFITDSYAHRLWVHEATDLFLVTSELCAHAVRSFRPRARVAVVTHPTRPAFYTAPSRRDARVALDVPDDARCVLLMSGAWGIGPVAECTRALAAAGMWVLAVAGSNRRLAERLRAAADTDAKIIPFGYTDRVPELMAASDIVVSSSGDTCREARVVGRGLVLLDVVPGHGRENLNHELELGNAVTTLPEPALLVACVQRFFDDGRHLSVVAEEAPQRWEHELRAALATLGVR